MAIKAKFLGRDAVTRKLRKLVPDAEKQAAIAQMEAAMDLASAIRPRAPRLTGEYADSIQGDRLSNRREAAVGARTKDPNATGIFASWKWRWLEFGTVKMPARPHIMPTFRAARKRIRRKVANAINKAVRKAKAG
ncbi:MAG TPA: HK97-gp10 family putative phage morphogenesis protein [Rhizobiaceae bacterium]|nr:HK97-gp10 family putative phage morphogenesis protein [Rhizobiaceae bacterium]